MKQILEPEIHSTCKHSQYYDYCCGKCHRQSLTQQRREIAEMIEGEKRTDDTQMSEDHIFDEALDTIINNLKRDER